MTIDTTNAFDQYLGDGTTTEFAFNFPAFEESWVEGWIDRVPQPNVVVVLNADQVNNAGGTLTFETPPPAPTDGEPNVTIYRSVPFTQLTDYPPFTRFPAEDHEEALDKLTMMCQQLAYLIVLLQGDASLYVLKAGDQMTGQLGLITPPTEGQHATSKTYVDGLISQINDLIDAINVELGDLQDQIDGIDGSLDSYVSKSGDTMTGALYIPTAQFTDALEAVNLTVVQLLVQALDDVVAKKSTKVTTGDTQTLTLTNPTLADDVDITTRTNVSNGLVKLDGNGTIPPEFIPVTGLSLIGFWDASTGDNPSEADPAAEFKIGQYYIIAVDGAINCIDPNTGLPVVTNVEVGGSILFLEPTPDNMAVVEGWYYIPPSSTTAASQVVFDNTNTPFVGGNVQEALDEMGNSATRDVVSDFQSTVADQIWRNTGEKGMFGLGSTILNLAGDLEGIPTATRFDSFDDATNNRPADFGTCLTMRYNSENMTQLAIRTGADSVYVRRKTANSWQGWNRLALAAELPDAANLVPAGTVENTILRWDGSNWTEQTDVRFASNAYFRVTAGAVEVQNVGDPTSIFQIRRTITDGVLGISGSDTVNAGANILLFGGTHAADPSAIKVRTGTAERMEMNADGEFGFGAVPAAGFPLRCGGNFRVDQGIEIRNSVDLSTWSYIRSASAAGRSELAFFAETSSLANGAGIIMYGASDSSTPNEMYFMTSGQSTAAAAMKINASGTQGFLEVRNYDASYKRAGWVPSVGRDYSSDTTLVKGDFNTTMRCTTTATLTIPENLGGTGSYIELISLQETTVSAAANVELRYLKGDGTLESGDVVVPAHSAVTLYNYNNDIWYIYGVGISSGGGGGGGNAIHTMRVDSDNTTVDNLPAGWSVANPTLGEVVVTHNLGYPIYPVATLQNNGTAAEATVGFTNISINAFTIEVTDGQAAPYASKVIVMFDLNGLVPA